MRYEVEEAVATFVRGLFQGATSVVPACLSTNVMGDRHGRTFVLKVVEGVAPVLYLTQAFGDEKTSPPLAKNLPAFLLHKINLGLRTKKQVCYALDLF